MNDSPSTAEVHTAQAADALVLFGITGDLAKKMLLPALYDLVRQEQLSVPIVGVTRGGWSVERLREHAHDAVAAHGEIDEDVFARFADLLRLATIDYDEPESFRSIAEQTQGAEFLAHYLAIPPELYAKAAACLAAVGLNDNARLIVEKPFGHDLDSARALQVALTEHFPEDRLRRVDHYLGKDAIEDLLTIRFANTMLSELMHRHHVRSVQITMAENFDVADRGGFYDATGALRDVVQNHMLQMLAYLVMEAPRTGAAADILDERSRALKAVRTIEPDSYVRGQYEGYLDVKDVRPDSTTETYTALRTFVDTDRWAQVPFVLRTGKALPVSATEIIVELVKPPARLLPHRGRPGRRAQPPALPHQPHRRRDLRPARPARGRRRDRRPGLRDPRLRLPDRQRHRRVRIRARRRRQRRPPTLHPDGHGRGILAHRQRHRECRRHPDALSARQLGTGDGRRPDRGRMARADKQLITSRAAGQAARPSRRGRSYRW
jgi:glucose-6-phosphate 1-dehydrogenase